MRIGVWTVSSLLVACSVTTTVGAFSPFLATKAVPPKSKATARAKPKALARDIGKKKSAFKPTAKKAAPKRKVAAKPAAAKKKVAFKPAAKKKVAFKPAAKKKVAIKPVAKKKVAPKKKPRVVAKKNTSITALQIARAGTSPELFIANRARKSRNAAAARNQMSFFGNTKKTPATTTRNAKKPSAAKNKPIASSAAASMGALNPLSFGWKVASSPKGKEATGILVNGGLKLAEAILEEGKKTQVIVPRGTNRVTGELNDPVLKFVGPKELIDASVFAGKEVLGTVQSVYDKLYVAGGGSSNANAVAPATAPKVTYTPGKKKNGKVVREMQENFYVNVGGQKVKVSRPPTYVG